MSTRRSFLGTLAKAGAILAAPAYIKADVLMPPRNIIKRPGNIQTNWDLWGAGDVSDSGHFGDHRLESITVTCERTRLYDNTQVCAPERTRISIQEAILKGDEISTDVVNFIDRMPYDSPNGDMMALSTPLEGGVMVKGPSGIVYTVKDDMIAPVYMGVGEAELIPQGRILHVPYGANDE